jgi:hypothetical protein
MHGPRGDRARIQVRSRKALTDGMINFTPRSANAPSSAQAGELTSGWKMAHAGVTEHATFRLMRSKTPHPMNRQEMKARRKWNSGGEWH